MDIKSICRGLDENLRVNKFNHLELFKFLKNKNLEISEEKWLNNLNMIKNLILTTQDENVVSYFYEDFLKIIKKTSGKGYFYQKILETFQENNSFRSFFIQQKNHLIPIFKNILLVSEGYEKILTESVLNLLSNDEDYEKIIPKVAENHFFYHQGNNIIDSEVWEFSYLATTRAFKINVRPHAVRLAYNNLFYAIVKVIKDYGFNIESIV